MSLREVIKSLEKIALIGILGLAVEKINAGVINVYNYTTSAGNQVLVTKNIPGATNGIDTAYDSTYLDPVNNPSLKIYTKVGEEKLKTDARPIDTLGWDFYLGVKGTVTGIDNALKFKPMNVTDLTGKALLAYDVSHPETIYSVSNVLNAITTVNLPNLTGTNVDDYSHWRLNLRDPAQASRLEIKVQKKVNGTWTDGEKPVVITYGENGATSGRNDAVVDVSAAWGNGFVSLPMGEFGLGTINSAFGSSILERDARANGDIGNILIEGYQKDTSFAENSEWKLVLNTNDPAFFSSFKIVQRSPANFKNDSRYPNQSSPKNLADLINASGDGELGFISQGALSESGIFNLDFLGNVNFGQSMEVDYKTGPSFSFDIIPFGGSVYVNSDNVFYMDNVPDGWDAVIHPTTPEPSTIGLLALGGIGLLARRRQRSGKESEMKKIKER